MGSENLPSTAATMDDVMKCVVATQAGISYPFGNDVWVVQPFPAAISAEDADPFLMCDEMGPSTSRGKSDPGGWHGHLGMDICTYKRFGDWRHADSLGNRAEFKAPGLQWMSVGSGVEHAEGSGAVKGEHSHGFQIWINVPAKHKLDTPGYGTEGPERMVNFELPGGNMRLLAGEHAGQVGAFKTKQPIQMLDLELAPSSEFEHTLPLVLDNCLVFVYEGSCKMCGQELRHHDTARFDATDSSRRKLTFVAGKEGVGMMIFAGKRINERIAWHGPFVMNTRAELRKAFGDYQIGKFPPVRCSWDYRSVQGGWND